MTRRFAIASLAFATWLAATAGASPVAAAEAAPAAPAARPALAGAWSQAADVEASLGLAGGEGGPAALHFALDEKPGAGWDEDAAAEIRAELDRLKYRIVATAQVRLDDRPAHEWIVTHRDGETFCCVVVPNLGIVAHRLALIPGVTADRDLLFVEWETPGGAKRRVSAYRRGHAPQAATRPATPPR